jgi:hypothetical protein
MYCMYLFDYESLVCGVLSASRVQLRSYLNERIAAPVQKTEITVVGFRCADHATHPIRTSPTSGGLSVGIVRSQTETTELSVIPCMLLKLAFGKCLVRIQPQHRLSWPKFLLSSSASMHISSNSSVVQSLDGLYSRVASFRKLQRDASLRHSFFEWLPTCFAWLLLLEMHLRGQGLASEKLHKKLFLCSE